MILCGYFLNARSTCIVQLNKKLKYMFGSLTFFNFLKYRIECGQGGVSNLVTRVIFFLYHLLYLKGAMQKIKQVNLVHALYIMMATVETSGLQKELNKTSCRKLGYFIICYIEFKWKSLRVYTRRAPINLLKYKIILQ